MPIINYEQVADTAEKTLLNSKKIDEKNKKYLISFLKAYDVRPATRAKFCKNIAYFLNDMPDIKTFWDDREKINDLFNRLKKDFGAFTYSTTINVSKTFARWLNDGDLPKGFKDIKTPAKKTLMRNLKPEDMWTWEDGGKAISHARSQQIKSAFLTQLDCGFRPSEFLDLQYGDVKLDNDVIIFHVRSGKTGKRDVPAYRCVPEFLKWYEIHPSKKKTDPLWITESDTKNTLRVIEYRNLCKHFETITKKAKLEKPYDFYSLRHSSCFLDKMEAYPLDLASERHGHSVEYFTQIYGRLGGKEQAERLRVHHGGVQEQQKVRKKSHVCVRCGYVNESERELCFKCSAPLRLDIALSSSSNQAKEISDMRKQMVEMARQMKELTALTIKNKKR